MTDTVKAIQSQVDTAVKKTIADPSVPAAPEAAPAIIDAVMNKIIPTVLHATNQEPWYQSRVFWSAVLSIIVAICGLFGLTVDADAQSKILSLIMAIIPAVSAGIALYSRYFAKKPLGQ